MPPPAHRDAPPKTNTKAKTRSRTGCSQCKSRRLKCDESKPECVTCVKNNRKCPGYGRSFRWSTKHEKALDAGGGKNLLDFTAVLHDAVLQPASRNIAPAPEKPSRNTPELAESTPSIQEDSSSTPSLVHEFSDSGILAEGDVANSSSPIESWVMPHYNIDMAISDLASNVFTQDFWPDAAASFSVEDAIADKTAVEEQSLAHMAPINLDYLPLATPHLSSNAPIQQTQYSSAIPRNLTNYSSVLVEEWFHHVCPIWSSFDSATNLNRTLAHESWTRSAAVMHCLQSMAAICLSTQIPYMKRVAKSHLDSAVVAIQSDLRSSRNLPAGELPSDLLLALCCVGTTACWLDTKEIGVQYLKETKSLLKRTNEEASKLSMTDLQKLYFFNNSLVYWNMLVAVVSDDQDDLGVPKPKKPSGTELPGPITPHPWTGISVSSQLLFMQAIRLCRKFRLRHNQGMTFTMTNLQLALGEIEEAQRIEEELLGLEQHEVEEISETGDKMSPRDHFVYVAEAYRLASLLQLYQTFPDLVARRLPEQVRQSSGYVPWDKWIVPLCLRLVNILRKIPVSSRTRCIQPLLYISASSGLRFDVDALMPLQESDITISTMPDHSNAAFAELDRTLAFPPDDTAADPSPSFVDLTKLSIQITHARRFILGRLSMLEHSLPPAPIIVAKQLVTAIWAAYDSETSRPNYTHWIDVMENLGLRTIFG
ncbi:hypothetical protein S7711_01728 [Stachybotrys chartarum IBT 7711]|uniref:Zn(2)-C6 fungal-type domain-containing protein n=1 Tax=Stachybotrys chartarum (strain CBS 109288 / IBT 7711) TaxID=1280523 RepID=A0A084AVE8_STACB|nr:hypothetical protein S7711_01728 [Stachybotrys chartarum IBT 7711]KFA46046.1 hypothetical protein S40293_07468 [Stachybotrys chartarum IBT 40293]